MKSVKSGLVFATTIACAQYAIADAPRYSSYDASKAVSYTNRWATSKNPSYPFYGDPGMGGDCTNFASQVLRTGGWQYTISREDKKITSWYVSLSGKTFTKSHTWSVADSLHRRLLVDPQEKSAKMVSSVEDLKPGDVVFMVKNKAAHHTMIVTQKVTTGWWWWKGTDIKVSYHNGGSNLPKADVSLKDMIALNPSELFRFVSISS